MEIMGYNIGLTPEDKEIVIGYLKPYVTNYVKGKVKDGASKAAPGVGLKVIKAVDTKLEDTDYKKTKFVIKKAKGILERPYVEKQEAKDAKKQAKLDKKEAKLRRKPRKIEKRFGVGPVGFTMEVKNPENKKNIRRAKKLKKLRAKGKISFKAKAISSAILMAHAALTTPKIINKH